MIIRVFAFLTFLSACASLSAQEPPKKEAIKKLAQTVADATVKGEYDKVIDNTHDGLVKMMGGRDGAIKTVTTAMKEIEKRGIAIKAFTISDPGEFLTEGMNTFVIVPTALEMTTPDSTVKSKSYLLGISSDGGKTWKFADGAGLDNKELREKALPKFPEKLKLPERSAPEIIKK